MISVSLFLYLCPPHLSFLQVSPCVSNCFHRLWLVDCIEVQTSKVVGAGRRQQEEWAEGVDGGFFLRGLMSQGKVCRSISLNHPLPLLSASLILFSLLLFLFKLLSPSSSLEIFFDTVELGDAVWLFHSYCLNGFDWQQRLISLWENELPFFLVCVQNDLTCSPGWPASINSVL